MKIFNMQPSLFFTHPRVAFRSAAAILKYKIFGGRKPFIVGVSIPTREGKV